MPPWLKRFLNKLKMIFKFIMFLWGKKQYPIAESQDKKVQIRYQTKVTF